MLEIIRLPENPEASSIETRRIEEEEVVRDGVASEDGDRNSTSNRWPREETMALLKIRSEMDVAFRDASTKAPLWEQVSRRLAELGYDRTAKKCKEKFENMYKYHRRTKEGRHGRPNGKSYRFFELLEALDTHPVLPPPSPEKSQEQVAATAKITATTDLPAHAIRDAVPFSIRLPSANMFNHSSSTTSSSSKESEQGIRKGKRKLTEFFHRLMKQVIERQEALQNKFMEVLEKCEQNRMAREEVWKMEELARIKRERELLAQERSIAAAKDAAVLAFLKKFTEQAGPVQLPEKILVDNPIPYDNHKDKQENVNGGSVINQQECTNGGNFMQMSSSRWPKEEVETLIRVRTNLDVQYEGNGPKGPLWEEISSEMKKIGYDRSAKRCKEKWENINKYFKRMKEKNKRRPEDSKTCPYFHQLDDLYSKKPKKVQESAGSGNELKPEELLMHIMDGQNEGQQLEASSEDADRDNTNQNGGDKEEGDGYHQIMVNSPCIAITG
ncbi:hypothetical protein L6164_025043 [Bauhinia variegata]|uniref:Uncharacterized protein n=1 Tax=Bauhinia variegata TaxID=167791 RepID=A0ACB9M089_BAUVA|nr:hypothetical protein L6164_025043 [Bauhinia variegata]